MKSWPCNFSRFSSDRPSKDEEKKRQETPLKLEENSSIKRKRVVGPSLYSFAVIS